MSGVPILVGPHCEKAKQGWKDEENFLPGSPVAFYEKHDGQWVSVQGW
jgi:hypothetical protein